MKKVEQFLQWLNENHIHIHCSPSVKGRVASLYRGSGPIESISHTDIFKGGGYLLSLENGGLGTICGHGKTDEDAIFDLCLNIADRDNYIYGKDSPILFLVCGDDPQKKVRIPRIEIEARIIKNT